MLKNVAIPLMLAATEAEAQREGLEEALRGDRAEAFDGLLSTSLEACTTDDGDAAAIASAAQEVARLEALKDAEKDKITELRDGTWESTRVTRENAVEAARAVELLDDVAGKLNDLDIAMGATRDAQHDLQVANINLVVGEARKGHAEEALEEATQMNTDILAASDAADKAVEDANTQLTRELLWRQWLYCELGSVPAAITNNAALVDDLAVHKPAQWWTLLTDDTSTASFGTSDPSAPAYCTVPASDDADGDTVERKAIRYYGAGAPDGLVAETTEAEEPNETFWSRWTAQFKYDTASTAEKKITEDPSIISAEDNFARSPLGRVNYYLGLKRMTAWRQKQREKMQSFFQEVEFSRDAVKTVVGSSVGSASYDIPANDAMVGLTTGNGAAKELAAKVTARDGDGGDGSGNAGAKGLLFYTPLARDSINAASWKYTYAVSGSAITAWQTAQTANSNSAGAVKLWWDAAVTLGTAVDDWHTLYDDGADYDIGGQTAQDAFDATANERTCDVSASEWVVDPNSAASAAACKTACETYNQTSFFADINTHGGSKKSMLQWVAASVTATTYCGAWNWDNGATTCKLWKGTGPLPTLADDTLNAANNCAVMTGANELIGKTAAITSGFSGMTDSLATNAKADITTQAALEKAWMNAWYAERYWWTVNEELTFEAATNNGSVQAGSMTDKIKNALNTLSTNTPSDTNTVVGATSEATNADTKFGNAVGVLEGLESATLEADATRSELGKRIVRATNEIIALQQLVTADNKGALDLAKIKRNAAKAAWVTDDDSTNQFLLAQAELAEATAAVKDFDLDADNGDAPIPDTNGQLRKDVAAAEEELAKVQGEEEDAQNALDGADSFTANGALTLAQLRQAVTDATAAWASKDEDLQGLVGTVAELEESIADAEDELKKAVMACQVASYDAFRTTLEEAMLERAENLDKIRKIIEGQIAAAPAKGQAGYRCEKALSNGTWRPKRNEQVCAPEHCCGAARVWMDSGVTGVDAMWRTIETCQKVPEDGSAISYSYQPPRAPMATSLPDPIVVPFTCIEGAKKLAAAASAVAAAVYMLA